MSSSHPDRRPPKRLSYLLPATAIESSSSSDSTGRSASSGPVLNISPIVPKRPRIGVPVACDRCRLKKIRCDGGKPACSSCHRKGVFVCHYDLPPSKNPSTEYLIEAIALLNSLPPTQVQPTLLDLRDLNRDTEIIAALRDIVGIKAQHQSDTSASFIQFLKLNHPFTYPAFEPINPMETSSYLKQLVNPKRIVPPHHLENLPVKSDLARKRDTQETTDDKQPATTPGPPPRDPALNELDMSKWTTVPVSDDFAAKAISLYLATDHSLLCPFNRDLFIQSLIVPDLGAYCSPSLVNALMFWCCQSYASNDPGAIDKVELFRIEAERLSEAETNPYTALNMATEMFLSLGYLMQGKDHASLRHLSKASNIGIQLCLFGVPEGIGQAALNRMTPDEIHATQYPAWGVFNWTVLMSLFYRQQGIVYPQFPPMIPIPGSDNACDEEEDDVPDLTATATADSQFSETTRDTPEAFTSLCKFWNIIHEVTALYYGNETASMQKSISLQFAEFKYRELLSWADAVPAAQERSDQSPDIVVILHLWLHSAILDIFRPFLNQQDPSPSQRQLKTFPVADSTPDAAYTASVSQLKQLVIASRSKYTSSNYTIIWQTALLYTANAMLRSKDEDRLEYFLICLYSFQGLRQCFRVSEAIAKALLSMAMQHGDISGALAGTILTDLRARAPGGEEGGGKGGIEAPFMPNSGLAMSDPNSATVEQLAAQFDESFWVTRYTDLFDPKV